MKLYSHPRSGTNWLLALLEQAFFGNIGFTEATTGHWSQRVTVSAPPAELFGGHDFFAPHLVEPRIYLYRDGRDVALSLWRTKAFQPQDWHNLSLSEFLRRPLDWQGTPGRRAGTGWTVPEHWRQHLDSWQNAGRTHFVRYEALLIDTESELARLGEALGRAPDLSTLDVGDVGPFPSDDHRIGKWREAFAGDDLDYFLGIVPQDYWGLWGD